MPADKDRRYFMDIEITTNKVLRCETGQRHELKAEEKNLTPDIVRIYLSLGQYNKVIAAGFKS